MLLLPKNLEVLARLTSPPGAGHHRYALDCVRVETDGTHYQAVATDGRFLGLVQGDVPTGEYPELEALTRAPNGDTSGLVKSADWKRAFRAAPKAKDVRYQPLLASVACVLGHKPCGACAGSGKFEGQIDCPQCQGQGRTPCATLGSTDRANTHVLESVPEPGARFPNFLDFIPTTEPRLRVAVDAAYLRDLLDVALTFAGADSKRVWLEFQAHDQPFVVRAESDVQRFTGLLVPLS